MINVACDVVACETRRGSIVVLERSVSDECVSLQRCHRNWCAPLLQARRGGRVVREGGMK